MSTTVPHALFDEFSRFIENRMGLHFPPKRWKDLERRLLPACGELGFESLEPCIRRLLYRPVNRENLEILARHLTIGETYFYRDPKCWQFIEEQVVPEILRLYGQRGRRLRIWVAGCSTGEEPYTIAMLLQRLITDWQEWNITLMATDINVDALRKASEGIYSEWSFRDSPGWIRKGYFRQRNEGQFKIVSHVRDMVSFSYLNLAEDPYPSLPGGTNGMDLILCRNVLMYLAKDQVHRILSRFHGCLVDEGWLIVAATEVPLISERPFTRIEFNGASFFRKQSNRSAVAKASDIKAAAKKGPPALNKPKVKAGVSLKPFPLPSPPAGPFAVPNKPASRVEKEPWVAIYERAVGMCREGRYAEAGEGLSTLLSDEQASGYPHGTACSLLSRCLANGGRLHSALQWSEKAIEADKTNPAHHFLHAVICTELGQGQDAVAALKRTLFLDQNFALAHYTLGNLLLAEGRIAEAGKHFRNALGILSGMPIEQELPESEGLTAGRLGEIIKAVINIGNVA